MKHKRWTTEFRTNPDPRKMLKMYGQRATTKEIAKEFNVCGPLALRWLRELHLIPPAVKRVDKVEPAPAPKTLSQIWLTIKL